MGDRNAAIAMYNQAAVAANDKSNPTNLTTAWQLFASACYADPTFALAHYQYGNNCFDQEKHFSAIAAYRRALSCQQTNEDRAKTLCNLGWNMHLVGRVQEAHKILLEAIDNDPTHPASWINLSNTLGLLDQPILSLDAAKRGYELDPNDVQNEVVLAFAHLFNRDFVEGFQHFESRFAWKLHSFLQYPYPRWQGEEINTLFLVADQGLGDTISFARFVELAAKKCKYIHAYVQPETLRLFTDAFVHLGNVNLLPMGGSAFPPADAWTTFVSLPFALGLTNDQIRDTPGIKIAKYSAPTSWMVPDTKLHVGIAWRGSEKNNINKHRSIPIEHFLELYKVPGIQLYSLQVGEHSEGANAEGANALVRNLVPYIRDVVDTLSLLRDLDLVVTCESALGHICSLIGKDCIIPYSFMGRDYRLGHTGTDRLWTPNHTIIRQDSDCRWEPVFDKVADVLRERVDAKGRGGQASQTLPVGTVRERHRAPGFTLRPERANLAVRSDPR